MHSITLEAFIRWMDAYGNASKDNNALASSALFSQDARYYETPFAEPMLGRQAIFQYWSEGAQTLQDKESSYEIIALQDNLGVARWQSAFTVIDSGKRLALDCLFLVEFDEYGLCSVFREWWHIQPIPVVPSTESS